MKEADVFVQHQPDQQRFVVPCGDDLALLGYRLSDTGSTAGIDFYTTYVPTAYRGHGIAEKLVRAGIQWAKAQGYEMRASCWYAAKFLR